MGQTVVVAPNENDTYIVSGWAAANAVNKTYHNNACFDIAVRVTYQCKDSSGKITTVYQNKDSATFNTTVSGWQYATTHFSLKYTEPESGKTYTPLSVLIVPRYCYQENYAYFDHIQLIKDEGQTRTYTYDEDGNVILTSVNSEQKVNTEYNDNNDLISYTDTAGYKTTATYDNKHNLLTTKSESGITTSNSYFSNGMVNVSEIQNSSNTVALKTESTLHSASNNALVATISDQHGYVTTYGRDSETGVIKSITTPDKVTTTKEYDEWDTKLKKVTTDGTSVSYTYNGNRIV